MISPYRVIPGIFFPFSNLRSIMKAITRAPLFYINKNAGAVIYYYCKFRTYHPLNYCRSAEALYNASAYIELCSKDTHLLNINPLIVPLW